MEINMLNTIDQMAKETLSVTGIAQEEALAQIKGVFEGRQSLLEELTQALKSGDISEDDFRSELEREKKIIEVELLTLQVMQKAMVQQAVNKAMDLFMGIVKTAVL